MAHRTSTSSNNDLFTPLSYSNHNSPVMDGQNNATFSSSSNTPDHLGQPTITTYDDSPAVPNSPSFSNNDTAFTYTPNPNQTNDLDGDHSEKAAIGGPLAIHPSNTSASDVEYGNAHSSNKKRGLAGMMQGKKKWYYIGGGVVLLLVAVGAVVGGIKGSQISSSSSSSGGIASNDATSGGRPGISSNPLQGPNGATGDMSSALGTNGSTVTMENGQTFTYVNNFGGYYSNLPFDDSAKAQSYTPALNESWDYTNMKMFGVNLGGWLVTEPFIVPGLFEPYENDAQPATDEYTLMSKYGSNATERMREHYDTFITEEDFALIAGAGLNWVRIPIGHWAVETVDGEPFVEGLSWTYLVKALNWARKYGLRVNLDLHTAPGSQNGWNHSGRLGSIGWLRGVMGLTNAQRSLNHIRTLTEFISQPQYKNVVPMFSILNEPSSTAIGAANLRRFNLHAYQMIRDITGTGEGNGPWIMIHDGFENFVPWRGFMSGSDRLAMDQHNYLVFTEPNNDAPGYAATRPCNYWGAGFNSSMRNFGLTVSGEWCLAINDCGQYLNNVGNGARYDGTYIAPGRSSPQFEAVGSCDSWNDYRTWSDERKAGMRQVAYAHMDALQNWFFWTWKIGVSGRTGIAPNPMWHMKLALQEGYFPLDPRQHVGKCSEIVANNGGGTYNTASAFTAFPSPWMTGGAGAGNIAPSQLSQYGQWPPQSFGDAVGGRVTNLPSLVPTGTPVTLAVATPTPTGVDGGNGWANPSDTAGWYAPKSGCNYLNPYSGIGAAVPTAAC